MGVKIRRKGLDIMGKSLGFIEISGVTAAVDALDIMCKTAGVEFVTWERRMGGRLVTIIVSGSVSEVTQAVESAVNQAIKKPVAHAVIANPHEEVLRMVDLSARKMLPQDEEM
jgi:ethanolamine utilization protein EutM